MKNILNPKKGTRKSRGSALLILSALLASQATAKVVILEAETQVYEIPRSQIKTYQQTDTLEANLKPVKALKPSAVSDEELVSIPEKYLPPELREKQKQIKDRLKSSQQAKKAMKKGDLYGQAHEADVVKIRTGKDKTLNLRIDEAVWVPPTAAKDGAILAPQRKLPDVELINEVKVGTSGKVAKEIKPGETREIAELFQNGQTKDPTKTPLLGAYKFYMLGDYATSTTLSLDVLSDTKNEDTRTVARYVLAHSLFQAGFYASSLNHLTELVTSKWRRSALGMAEAALERTRDDGAANQILSKISISQIPDEYRALFSFHLGRILLNTGAREAALAAFKRVPSDHKRYPEAQYYTGVILTAELGNSLSPEAWEKEGTPTYQAREHFENAMLAARTQDAQDLINLIRVSMARLAYQSKQYNQSIFFYNDVTTTSPFVRESAYETAWSLYRIGEFNRSLGVLHPLGSRYFEARDLPEVWILRSLNYLKLCRFDEAKRAANEFEVVYKKVTPEYQAALRKLQSLTLKAPSQLKDSGLNPWIKELLLSDAVVQKDLSREDLLGTERARLEVLKNNLRISDSELKDSATKVLQTAIDRKIAAVGMALKPYLVSRLSDIMDEFKTQKERLDFLRFEIYNQATKFPKALERPEAKKVIAKGEFLPGVFLKGRETLWKFAGEYWLDELRGYDYFIPTECRSEDL